jgi:thiamine-monophosphate kinase
MVENVHFRREWTSFSTLGAKAFAVNASDIIAMGGEPSFVLLSVSIPQEDTVEDLESFFDGFLAAATERNVALIGGNMSAAPCLMLSVTLLGHAPHGIVPRSGAQVGDDLYVTGTLGDAALGLRLFQNGQSDGPADGQSDVFAQQVKDRFLCPTIRYEVSQALASQSLPAAMLDVSDGLLQDLGHMCEESHTGAVVEAAHLPLSKGYTSILGRDAWALALTGGEDYELLFSAPVAHRPLLQTLAQTCECAITRIGTIVSETEGITVLDAAGQPYTPVRAGHDHFRRS